MSKIRIRKGNVEDAPHIIVYFCKSLDHSRSSFYLVPYNTWSMHKWSHHALKMRRCAIRAYKTEGRRMIEGMYD